MSKSEIKAAVSGFLNLIERGGADEAAAIAALELLLDRLAVARPYAQPKFENGQPDPPHQDCARFRSLAADRFPSFGLYNLPDIITDRIAESNLIVGDALDDLTDIARDLSDVAWRFEHTTEGDALYDFAESYDHHWRWHLRHLQFYLEALRSEQPQRAT